VTQPDPGSGGKNAPDAVGRTLPRVDVVTVSHNGGALLARALASFDTSTGVDLRTIVVDNASSDDSAAVASALGAEVRRLPSNIGYGAALNRGVELASAEFVVCANQDIEVRPDTIAKLVAAMVDHDAICGVRCVVGGRLMTPAGDLAETCHAIPSFGQGAAAMLLGRRMDRARNAYGDGGAAQHCGWVSAAFILIRRDLFSQLHGFDPSYFMYVEDLEFFTRVRDAGAHCLWLPTADVVHVGSGGGLSSPELHAHALWNWKKYYAAHARRAGPLAGEAILYAGIVSSVVRGGMWWLRARRGEPLAAERASFFLRGGLLGMVSTVRRRPPLPAGS
jgi:GT2 family glycosyltransferase